MCNKSKIKNLGGFIAIDKKTISEIDYLDKLNPEQKAWLERFLDNEYNAHYTNDGTDLITNPTERRELNRLKQRRLKDFTNQFYVSFDPEHGPILIPKTDYVHEYPEKVLAKSISEHPKKFNKSETLEEFLARGGKITKIK